MREHLGYILYFAVLLYAYGSPLLVYLIYKGYKQGHALRNFALFVLGVPVAAALLYGLFWAGLLTLSAVDAMLR